MRKIGVLQTKNFIKSILCWQRIRVARIVLSGLEVSLKDGTLYILNGFSWESLNLKVIDFFIWMSII